MKKNNIIVIIPSRINSQRLPEKAMALINKKPMITHVWKKAVSANIGPVYVATDSDLIFQNILNEGGLSVLTDKNLPSGTDRVHQALTKIDPKNKFKYVINLQGDLPELDPELLITLRNLLINNDWDLTTLVSKININEAKKEQIVKTAINWINTNIGRAIYFSRSPIPNGAKEYWHHIGIYGWKRKSLEKFVNLEISELENTEKLEQLRALEANMSIGVAKVNFNFGGIDTLDDLIACRKRFTN